MPDSDHQSLLRALYLYVTDKGVNISKVLAQVACGVELTQQEGTPAAAVEHEVQVCIIPP